MEVLIRNARMDEGKLLAGIERACFPPLEAASEEAILERLQTFPENFFVAEVDGKVVGFVNGGVTKEAYLPDEMYHNINLHCPDGKYQTVFGLNVLAEYRRNGIGGMLIRHLVQVSKERGKAGVILTCKDFRIPFYESLGFVNYGVSDSEHGNAAWYDMRQYFENI